MHIISFFALFAGGLLISVRKSGTFIISKALYLMLFSSFLLGIYHTLTKFVYLQQDFYDGFILIRVGSFIGALTLLLAKDYRQALFTIASLSNKVKGMVLIHEILNLVGLAFFNFAVSIGPVSLISAATGIQSIFVLILASLLSFKMPELIKEELNKRIIAQKLVAIVLIIVGAGIIVLS